MPRPSLRSRSFRRVKVSTPGGKHVIHYLKRRPGPAKCGSCKKPLSGVPRLRPGKLAKLPKTKKRPERPYGGQLCTSCSRELFRKKNMERWENV